MRRANLGLAIVVVVLGMVGYLRPTAVRQSYQGYTKIALRTYGTTYNEAMLDELITYEMFEAAGLPAPQVAYTGVQVNDESGKLYLVSQVLDETYLEQHFDNPDGVLFKECAVGLFADDLIDLGSYALRLRLDLGDISGIDGAYDGLKHP